MKKLVVLLTLWLCLFAARGFAAEPRIIKVDAVFSVAIPSDWEVATDNFQGKIPKQLADIFDGANYKDKSLKVVGWKREGEKNFIAAFAIVHTKAGAGKFHALLKASGKDERARIAARFCDTLAEKVLVEYIRKRSMEVEKNSVEMMDAGDMTIVLADALVQDGGTVRTRSETIYFRGDSLVGVTSLYSNKHPAAGKNAEDVATSIIWASEE